MGSLAAALDTFVSHPDRKRSLKTTSNLDYSRAAIISVHHAEQEWPPYLNVRLEKRSIKRSLPYDLRHVSAPL